MYDVIVIGGGPAGYICALEASLQGFKTALIEGKDLGGTCLNVGCIPTKALLHGSSLFDKVKHNQEGVIVGDLSFDQNPLYQYKNNVVEKLKQGISMQLKQRSVTYFKEFGRFLNNQEIELSESKTILKGRYIIIATGSSVFKLPFLGNDSSRVVTSDDVLKDPLLGESICILGGGVIGCELALYYHQIGKKVTIIELEDRVLNFLDKELSQSINMLYKQKGINLICGAALKEVKETETLEIFYEKAGTMASFKSDYLLVAVGRTGNTSELALDNTDIETQKSFIQVDDHYKTSVENIYAIGDVSGAIQLAHVAEYQGKDVIRVLMGEAPLYKTTHAPACLYLDPEVAYVGALESDDPSFLSVKVLMGNNGRHLIETKTRSFIKVVFKANGEMVGAQLLCEKATELVSYFTMIIEQKLLPQDLEKMIFPHPTITEVLNLIYEQIKIKISQ